MARFFGGMGGSGSGSRFGGGKKDNKNSGSSLERALASKKSPGVKKASEMTGEERYQALMKEKMNASKDKLMQTKKFSHQMPGVAPMEKEMSKSTQMALEIMAAKMAKREMKKKKPIEDIEIKATFIGGAYSGYIDAKGRVYGAGNKQVLQIDKKTGDIKTVGFFGRKIGKYDPKSNYCFNKIQKQLEKHAVKNGYGNTNVWGASDNKPQDTGNIWGTSNNDDKGGTGWW